MRISSPPVKYPCHFGINTPNAGQLIGSKLKVEGVRKLWVPIPWSTWIWIC